MILKVEKNLVIIARNSCSQFQRKGLIHCLYLLQQIEKILTAAREVTYILVRFAHPDTKISFSILGPLESFSTWLKKMDQSIKARQLSLTSLLLILGEGKEKEVVALIFCFIQLFLITKQTATTSHSLVIQLYSKNQYAISCCNGIFFPTKVEKHNFPWHPIQNHSSL